eukprot:354346-Chlamydomonas_euryale.AAC.20
MSQGKNIVHMMTLTKSQSRDSSDAQIGLNATGTARADRCSGHSDARSEAASAAIKALYAYSSQTAITEVGHCARANCSGPRLFRWKMSGHRRTALLQWKISRDRRTVLVGLSAVAATVDLYPYSGADTACV